MSQRNASQSKTILKENELGYLELLHPNTGTIMLMEFSQDNRKI